MKRLIYCLLIFTLVICLAGCSSRLPSLNYSSSSSEEEIIYTGSTEDADVIIDMPHLRQYGKHTSATTCVQMIMNWLDPVNADENLNSYEEYLGTSKKYDTQVSEIVSFFVQKGVRYEKKEDFTLQEIKAFLKDGHPVMMAFQAWGTDYNTSGEPYDLSDLSSGHWAICIGYNEKENLFYFNDPARVPVCAISGEELDARWKYSDDGDIYTKYGIVIKDVPKYDPDGTIPLE